MNHQTAENTKEHKSLDVTLSDSIDKEILKDLDDLLNTVRQKSRALASSLQRCFDNARKSMRYVIVYNLGKERDGEPAAKGEPRQGRERRRDGDEELEKYLADYLKDYFEKNDFMHYREFIRLNRACAIDVGIDVSSKIKDMYNDFFSGKRLIRAYQLGREGFI